MPRKKKETILDTPLTINETPNGVSLLVDHRVIPRWIPPRKPKDVTLEEFALEADGYPVYSYDIPKGERVFLIKKDIYDEKGKVYPHAITGLFAPLLNVINNTNVVVEGYLCHNIRRKQTELVLCDCFFAQDWNTSKIIAPIQMRLPVLTNLVFEANIVFEEMIADSTFPLVCNFHLVSYMWMRSITDVRTHYAVMKNSVGGMNLILIDSRTLPLYDINTYIHSPSSALGFYNGERYWMLKPSVRKRTRAARVKSVKEEPAGNKSIKNDKIRKIS